MAFLFSIPNLPPATYALVKRVSTTLDMSQRQVIIAALVLLNEEGLANRARVDTLLQRVKADHPRRRRGPRGRNQPAES